VISDFDIVRQALESAYSDAMELGGEPSAEYVKRADDALFQIRQSLETMTAYAELYASEYAEKWGEYRKSVQAEQARDIGKARATMEEDAK
jgi:L-rhamnose mutarotase